MRLIDADILLQKQYRIDDSSTLSTRNVVNIEDIDEMPTVCDIEQIRAEIEQLKTFEYIDGHTEIVYSGISMKNKILQIISKYTGNGSSETDI